MHHPPLISLYTIYIIYISVGIYVDIYKLSSSSSAWQLYPNPPVNRKKKKFRVSRAYIRQQCNNDTKEKKVVRGGVHGGWIVDIHLGCRSVFCIYLLLAAASLCAASSSRKWLFFLVEKSSFISRLLMTTRPLIFFPSSMIFFVGYVVPEKKKER